MNLSLENAMNYGDLSRLLAEKLRDYIAEQGIRPGERLPSNREIARQARVSQVTARMAVKKLEKEGLLECRKHGSFVRAHPEPAQRRSVASKRIGVVLSPWDSREQLSWDSRDLIGGLINEFCRDSIQMLLFSYPQWLDYAADDPFALIAENNLNSLIWLHCSMREIAFISRLEERKFPQVLFNRRCAGLSCPAVLQDQEGMMNDIVSRMSPEEKASHLIICGDPCLPPYAERYAALRKGLLATENFDSNRVLQLPEEAYPEWAIELLRRQIIDLKPRVLIDLIGYMENLAAVGLVGEVSGPRCVSVAPPDAWNSPPTFEYDYYTYDLRAAGRYANQQLNGEKTTVLLPFVYHGKNERS